MAAQRGIDLTLLTRGRRAADLPAGVKTLAADVDDPDGAARALGGASFDVAVDWIAFTEADAERDLRLFRGRVRQYVFISSASVYQKPPAHFLITESTPLSNSFWEYSRNKIAAEERLMKAHREEGFPVTIVRPSHTYAETRIPLAVNSSAKPYTAVDRMRRGKKVIVPGDGSSLWVLTHSTDFAQGFVGLLGLELAIGHAFHITSDDVMPWDQIYRIVGAAAGVEPQLVHIPSDFIGACLPEALGGLIGDKAFSTVFDNTKIKRFVPGYCATVPFGQGVRQSLAWFDADAARRTVDDEAGTRWDRLIEAYEKGLAEAVRQFRAPA